MGTSLLGYKINNDIRFPSDKEPIAASEVKKYTLPPDELERYRSNSKPNEKRQKQRNLTNWHNQDKRKYAINLEWDMDVINKFINMWIDNVPGEKMSKALNIHIDYLGIMAILLCREGKIKPRPGGIYGK